MIECLLAISIVAASSWRHATHFFRKKYFKWQHVALMLDAKCNRMRDFATDILNIFHGHCCRTPMLWSGYSASPQTLPPLRSGASRLPRFDRRLGPLNRTSMCSSNFLGKTLYSSLRKLCFNCLQTKQMIERLQTLVSSDGRFKNMREALHRLAAISDF